MKTLLDVTEDEIAIISAGISLWTSVMNLTLMCLAGNFNFVREFRQPATVLPLVLNALSSLLLLTSSLVLSVRSRHVKVTKVWNGLVFASLLIHTLSVVAIVILDSALISPLDDPTSDDGMKSVVNGMMNAVSLISIIYNFTAYFFTWSVMLYSAWVLNYNRNSA